MHSTDARRSSRSRCRTASRKLKQVSSATAPAWFLSHCQRALTRYVIVLSLDAYLYLISSYLPAYVQSDAVHFADAPV